MITLLPDDLSGCLQLVWLAIRRHDSVGHELVVLVLFFGLLMLCMYRKALDQELSTASIGGPVRLDFIGPLIYPPCQFSLVRIMFAEHKRLHSDSVTNVQG